MGIEVSKQQFIEWLDRRGSDYLRHAQIVYDSQCPATAVNLLYKTVRVRLQEFLAVNDINLRSQDIRKLFASAKSRAGHLEQFRQFINDLAEEFDAEQIMSKPYREFGTRYLEFRRTTKNLIC